MTRVLVLGGTTEATALARALAAEGVPAVFSYAGRTDSPLPQPLPVRVGGFGGPEGLVDYLRRERITHVVDATHPFAARMSNNAFEATAAAGVALCALERAPWQAGPDDDWRHVPDMDAAVAALPAAPHRIFLAIGKQHLAAFAGKAQHHYLLRLVDPPETPPPVTNASIVIARGPFDEAGDRAILQQHRIDLIVAKNSGGSGADAKLKAARRLRIPVILIERPKVADRIVVREVAQVLAWIKTHPERLGV